MEIEQKERERIEADIDAYIKDLWHDVNSPNNNSPKIVEAITHFRAGKQSEHLHLQKEVIQPMQSVMIAAAEEIQRCWPTHCDAEGYGPTNLMHRLEKGIPSQYGYTAGAFAKLEAEIKALREAKLTVNEREWALKYRLLILDAKTLAVKTNQLELAAMIRAIEVHVNEILLPTPNQK